MRRALATALLVCVSVAPAAAAAPAPSASAVVVSRYLDALRAHDYARAYAMLAPAERAYVRSATNFASGFAADGYALSQFAIVADRASGAAHVVLVREHIALDDPAHDVRATTVVTVPYLVSAGRVTDAGRPWRAFAANASAANAGVRVSVKRVAFYARAIRIVVTMQNDGAGFITLLPYGRSVLRDDAGDIFRPLVTRDWQITDEQLFLGLRLAPNSRYTGTIAFATPQLDDRVRRFELSLGPSVRDGATLPVAVDVAGIVPRS
jgi:hypothetical protein